MARYATISPKRSASSAPAIASKPRESRVPRAGCSLCRACGGDQTWLGFQSGLIRRKRFVCLLETNTAQTNHPENDSGGECQSAKTVVEGVHRFPAAPFSGGHGAENLPARSAPG